MSSPLPILLQAHDICCGPLQNINFNCPAGLSWICGDEGTGKTTLLRILAGDLQPSSGTIDSKSGSVFLANFQGIEHDYTTVDACWETIKSRCPDWNEDLFQELTRELDMVQHQNKQLHMLSTGSRRKVTVIAALACGASVTLLDQPFVALDQASIQTIRNFLQEAAHHTQRAWIVADYESPIKEKLSNVLDLNR